MVADPLRFERFDKSRHRRESFDCGDPGLNDYFRTKLNQQMRRGVTVGYVLADPTGRVAGYVTLSSGELPVGVTPAGRGYPLTLPLPTTLIGRLGVDLAHQGRGLGGDLLMHAMRIAVRTAENVAAAVIEVDALTPKARQFYEHFGFARLTDDDLHLYLPMSDAKAIVEAVFGNP